jgi:hypothetical protein
MDWFQQDQKREARNAFRLWVVLFVAFTACVGLASLVMTVAR